LFHRWGCLRLRLVGEAEELIAPLAEDLEQGKAKPHF
jgi:hypothetical protein